MLPTLTRNITERYHDDRWGKNSYDHHQWPGAPIINRRTATSEVDNHDQPIYLHTIYKNPHGIEAYCPINAMYQFSHYHHISSMPDTTIPVELNYTMNTNTILPFCPSIRIPPSPHPVTFLSYIHSLPQWEQLLLERVHLHTATFTFTS